MSAQERVDRGPPILMEGVLEKLKEREFPWILSAKKFSTTWVLRYYVLRHADTPDPEAFLLEQHEDCTHFSKVRKTLDLRRVVQVDTNISLKVGSQNWILAIHYKSKHGGKMKVLYLAAHSETEMNLWISKLCYACKLEKQDDEDTDNPPVANETANESPALASSRNSRDSDASCKIPLRNTHAQVCQMESSRLPSNNTSDGTYVNPLTTHAYIRLKDCSSNRSLGSSSASLSSSVTTSSSTTLDHSASENVSSKNSFLIPPPIPPKPSPSISMKKDRNIDSGGYILDQPLTPPDISEVLDGKEQQWSSETIRPDTERTNSDVATPVLIDSVVTPTISDSDAPKPLPRRRDYRNIPPEVDRSCKPTSKNRNRRVNTGTGQERRSSDEWRGDAYGTSSRMLSAHPSRQHCMPAPVPQNKQEVPVSQEALYGNGLMGAEGGVLDYLDPIGEQLAEASSAAKPSQRPKTSCATEYTQIDEESTKAVLEANVRQDEMRRKGFV